MTLCTYRGNIWRVVTRYWMPFPYAVLETPSGARCAAPSSQVEIQEGRG